MVGVILVILVLVCIMSAEVIPCYAQTDIQLENKYLKYTISADGKNVSFIGKRTGEDYLDKKIVTEFSRITKDGSTYNASSVSYADSKLTVQYGASGVSAVLGVRNNRNHFVFEVLSVSVPVDELTIVDIPLTLGVKKGEKFAGCALALNLQTNVYDIPGPNNAIRAICYKRYGLAGSKAAIVGCPAERLRDVLKDVLNKAPDLPKSNIGGPWAAEAGINRGSYIIDTIGVTTDNVDKWIKLTRGLGADQIDLHVTFRWGDFKPHPQRYPNGKADVKTVLKKLREAGIKVGLHNYAFFIDKTCPYVTPVPDPRLAKDAVFTLKSDMNDTSNAVSVEESTEKMSTIINFHVRNSVTVQIDDELIVYTGVNKTQGSYAFTGCQRGAYGTKVSPHAAGSKVHHLKECFGLFVPDPESTLFTEIAQNMADTMNEYDFDMIYFDALDGEDILAGQSEGWYYGSKFVYEVANRLKRPALMEMSTYHHHLWCVRSRFGAWDRPIRSHKGFTDIHISAIENGKNLLPVNLGWTCLIPWSYHNIDSAFPMQLEPTYQDDIEYLMGKCVGWDAGLSYIAVTPDMDKMPMFRWYAPIIAQYEKLRHSGYFSKAMKAKLRVPGDDYKLEQTSSGKWKLRPVQYERHKVNGRDRWSNVWTSHNKFAKQPVKLRIQSLLAVGDYDGPGSFVIEDFTNPAGVLSQRGNQEGVTSALVSTSGSDNEVLGRFTALSTRNDTESAWCKVGKVYSPYLDMSSARGLGVWVYGDGKGEILNVQFTNPTNVPYAANHHYIKIDFTGWRYFPLVEPEGLEMAKYTWPDITSPYYATFAGTMLLMTQYNDIETFSFWYMNLPNDQQVECLIRPVRAVTVSESKLTNPSITINGKTITFPVELPSGYFIEFNSMDDCKMYGKDGEFVKNVVPTGSVPTLNAGDNQVKFDYSYPPGSTSRAYVTVISTGKLD